MKKIIALLLALLMVLSIAGCSQEKEPEQNPEPEIAGGWNTPENGEITDELKALFEKAVGPMTGASYEPLELIGTQVVAGKNYKFLAKQTLVTNPPVEKQVYVTIYEDLEGNVSVTNIEETEGQSEEAKGLTSIPLGGNLKDISVEYSSLGSYVEIDFPENSRYVYENTECHLYYCSESDNPYITTYRWAKNGKTLSEAAEEEAEALDGLVQFSTWDEIVYEENNGITDVAFITFGDYLFDDENYYLCELLLFEDGDDFVEICFDNATEELRLGDTDCYIFVPKGYSKDLNTEEFMEKYGSLFYVDYDEDYVMPNIFVAKFPEDAYGFEKWFWSDIYPETLPVSEETYNKWIETGWDEESIKGYAEGFGIRDYEYVSENEINGYRNLAVWGYVDDYYIVLSYFEIDGDWYIITTTSKTNPIPKYSKAISYSLHTK